VSRGSSIVVSKRGAVVVVLCDHISVLIPLVPPATLAATVLLAWSQVRDDGDTSTTWALYTYAPTGQAKIAVEATGAGFDHLLAKIDDEKVRNSIMMA